MINAACKMLFPKRISSFKRLFSESPAIGSLKEKSSDLLDDVKKTRPSMLLGFTCKICDTRTHRNISKLAYTKGIVLVQCPHCQNRHLIADHLGWFKQQQGEGVNGCIPNQHHKTIEEIMNSKGEQIRKHLLSGELEIIQGKENIV